MDAGTRGHVFWFLWLTFSALANRVIHLEVLIKELFPYWANQRPYCETCAIVRESIGVNKTEIEKWHSKLLEKRNLDAASDVG